MTLALGYALFGLAVVLGVSASPSIPRRVSGPLAVTAWLSTAAGAAASVAAGTLGMTGQQVTLPLGVLGSLGTASLRVDRLSGLFLVISFGVAVPALLVGAQPAAAQRPRLPAVVAASMAALLTIFSADHLFVLLFGWESLTFSFYLLTGYDRGTPGRGDAAVGAVVFGKVSGACLLAGGLLLAAHAHSFVLAGLGHGAHGGVTAAGYALLLVGFGAKVGLLPLHVWLPASYAAAAPSARALMAGAAVNAGFYGMWRTLFILGAPPIWLVAVLLVVAGVTAVLGIAHCTVSPDLARLIAWSSVENAGVITAGYAMALAGTAAGLPQLTAVGLLAATAQVIAHSLGKSLLFLAAGEVEDRYGTTDLDRLRGIARRLPWTGGALVVGAMTLAGLPLTAGFVSEWFTLEALMQQFRVHRLPIQLAAALTGSLVALTVGVAGVAFVRLIALTAFSVPDRPPTGSIARTTVATRAAVLALSAGCLALAAAAPLEVRFVATGLRPIVGQTTNGALKSPWVLQPVFPDFSILSPSWLWIWLPVLAAVAVLLAVTFGGTRAFRVRRVPVWSSGSPGTDRGSGYTSFGYANPMRRVLANLLATRSELDSVASDVAAAQSDTEIPGSGVPPAVAGDGLHYRVDVVEVVERYLFRPLVRFLLAASAMSKRLQSGRLDAYMAYMLVTVIAVLALVTAIGSGR